MQGVRISRCRKWKKKSLSTLDRGRQPGGPDFFAEACWLNCPCRRIPNLVNVLSGFCEILQQGCKSWNCSKIALESSYNLEFILFKNLNKTVKKSKLFIVRVEYHLSRIQYKAKHTPYYYYHNPQANGEAPDFQSCLNLLQYLKPFQIHINFDDFSQNT